MKPILQLQTTERYAYLRRATRYARRKFNQLIETLDYRHAHESHAAAAALRLTEERFTDLKTFGVEGFGQDSFTIQYLNTGGSYEPTVCYYKGRFTVACWGDIAERYPSND